MWKRAWKDTRNFFGWNKKTIISIPIIWIVGSTVLLFLRGAEAVIDQTFATVAYGLIAVVLFAIFVFSWYLVKAHHYNQFRRTMRAAKVSSKTSDDGGKIRILGIKVENTSTQSMKNCYAKLIDSSFLTHIKSDWYFPSPGHFFPWSLHYAQGHIDIPPNGSEDLEVVECMKGQDYFYTCTLGVPDFQRSMGDIKHIIEYIIEIGWGLEEIERMKVQFTFTVKKSELDIKSVKVLD